ncbi:fumarate hydratase [Candidatus Bathyarchaeota archaeon]|nr:MAG: fumarate hydratase [Candidatus Bathyarchaeota archaeon]
MKKIELCTPISEENIRRLNVGDYVFLNGTIITARDLAHRRMMKYMAEKKSIPFSLEGMALYHCGPLVKAHGDEWTVLAAGPTTSMRMESFEDGIIENLGVRLIIGKGGMGEKTREAMRRYGAAYAAFTGGAAVLAAKCIKRIIDVKWLDLGLPEAVWIFEVKHFGPLIIGIDSHGRSIYEEVRAETLRRLSGIIKDVISE